MKFLAAIAALLLASPAFAQTGSTVHGLPTVAATPMAPLSCIYVDEGPGLDRKQCAGSSLGATMAFYWGALAVNNNLADVQSAASALANIGGVGPATTTTLTNKTFNCASNVCTVRLPQDISGVLPPANGGTGQSAFLDGQLLIGNTATGSLNKSTLTAGTGVTISNFNGGITIAATGGTSGVSGPGTSVNTDLAIWNGTLGNAISDSGLLLVNVATTGGTQTLTNKTINGVNNTLTVRAASDITGILPFGNGGTGQSTYTDGQLLIGSTSTGGLSKATITAGSGVTVTNGGGTITIASTGTGGVSGPGSSVNTDLAVWNGTAGNALADGGILVASVVTLSGTQGLTNKTINCASNTCTVRAANDITGVLPVVNGGNGQSVYTNGQIMIGDSGTGGLDKATLTAGNGMTITNAAGSITVGITGAAVAAGAANQVPVYTGAQTIIGTGPVANAVLITNSASVPSLSGTLPSGLNIPAPVISGAASFTGNATGITQPQTDTSTKLATTAFTKSNWLSAALSWVAGVNPNNTLILPSSGQARTVQAIRCREEIAEGAAATLSIYKVASGTSLAAGGVILHSGSFNANATAATDQVLALIGGATESIPVGTSIGVQTTGGWTTNVGGCTVEYTPA